MYVKPSTIIKIFIFSGEIKWKGEEAVDHKIDI